MMSVSNLATKDAIHNHDDFLEYAISHGFGDLHFKVDAETGMKAIIAIHSTKLGPALGGCRFISYPTTQAAIYDAMRLARGMSYKAALVNLPLGGGKAVVIQPSAAFDRNAYMTHFGQFVNELGGRYITALDSGTQLSDMDIINQYTPYVASLSGDNGDPSPFTARGVLKGIQAAVLYQLGKDSLKDLHIAIQGLGHVGYMLARLLFEQGAKLTVADINPAQVDKVVNEFNANAASTDVIHAVPCDVFSPCALGGIINDVSINQLNTSIIAGAANNQLAHNYHAKLLHEKGILYATDYVINAGGLVYAASKYLKFSEAEVTEKIDGIHTSLLKIFDRSEQENCSVSEITDMMAQEKLVE